MLDQTSQVREYSQAREYNHYGSASYPILIQKHIGNRLFFKSCVCAAKIEYAYPSGEPSLTFFSSFQESSCSSSSSSCSSSCSSSSSKKNHKKAKIVVLSFEIGILSFSKRKEIKGGEKNE